MAGCVCPHPTCLGLIVPLLALYTAFCADGGRVRAVLSLLCYTAPVKSVLIESGGHVAKPALGNVGADKAGGLIVEDGGQPRSGRERADTPCGAGFNSCTSPIKGNIVDGNTLFAGKDLELDGALLVDHPASGIQT